MSISWSFEEQRGVAVMRFVGLLGSGSVDRSRRGSPCWFSRGLSRLG